ncbi:hypothetical protein G5V57_24965 [Nordella sp. HKS 07]|uniref:hypothetical protein n=1 Tax=Nordella sp. HKS 07 TaxID=2712222 RepID=UPI0013E1CFEC|nr:hypothetical protein [Nordella sp. HKS 07]QIG50698.1 hypothetical protein G5V57_24965 [Nordella sp. HKS 07]
MALGLRIILEIVQALLRAWNKKDEGNLLENVAQTSTLAKVQIIRGQPLNAAGLRAVERTTQLGFGGTGTHRRPENTNKGLRDPRVHIDMGRKLRTRRSSCRSITAEGPAKSLARAARPSPPVDVAT